MRGVNERHIRRRPDERGYGVLPVLALILALSLLLLVVARLATTAISSAFKDQSATSAFHAAEAGLNHLMFAVSQNPDFDTGQRLPADIDQDGLPDFGAQGERGWVLARAATSGDLLPLTSGEAVFIKPGTAGGARGDVLYAVGYVPNRAAPRAVHAVRIVYSTGIVAHAIVLTEGDLVINGNPSVLGIRGSVHSNANLSISGNPTIALNATAAGTYSQSGVPTIGGVSGGGRPRVRMPVINPAVFRPLADYELRANGRVYAGQSGAAGVPGTPLADTTGGVPYRGWVRASSSPVRWTVSGNTAYAGTYYVEGDVSISGNLGSLASPWATSIFATGSIEVSGTPVMTAATDGLGLIAGGDLKINGNASQSYNGAMLAREQVMISGNPVITGYVVATNAAATSTLVTGASTISGNATITYNDVRIPIGITVDLWQELGSGLP